MKLIKAILFCIGILSCYIVHAQTKHDNLKYWVYYLADDDIWAAHVEAKAALIATALAELWVSRSI